MKTPELLFELSHPTRLEIFRLLAESSLRLSTIAKRVQANTPETSRHLDRLRSAHLVEKDPEGAYSIAPAGRVLREFLPGLDFLAANWEYFRHHDLSLVPPELLARVGDLSRGRRDEGIYCNLEAGGKVLTDSVKRFTAAMAELPPDPFPLIRLLRTRVEQGLSLRIIVEPKIGPPEGLTSAELALFHVVPRLPAVLCASDVSACIGFPDRRGRMDFMEGFSSQETRFVGWCEDLAAWLWNHGQYVQATRT